MQQDNKKSFVDAFVTTIEANIEVGEKLAKKLATLQEMECVELGIDTASNWLDRICGEDKALLLDLERAVIPHDPKMARA